MYAVAWYSKTLVFEDFGEGGWNFFSSGLAWLAGWLAGQLAGWLVGWLLTGWLAGMPFKIICFNKNNNYAPEGKVRN